AAPGANLTVGAATDGAAVDFGGTAGPRKLLNVAAGTLSETSFDAVNGSQLNSVDQRVHTLYDSLAKTIGSGDTVGRATGLMGLPSFTIQGQGASDVTNAFALVNGQFTLQSNVITSLNDISVQYASDDANGNGIIDAGEVDYTSVLLRGTGGTTLGNVANGAVTATSTEAVNGSQLFGASRNTAAVFGGGASIDVNGNWTGPAYTIQNTTFNNVGDALTSLDGQVTKNTTTITNIDKRVTTNEGDITTINTKLGDINTGKAGLVQQAAPGADLTVGAATDGDAVDL
ncbi:hypothetical protein K9U38_21895, partial [Phyllobacterium sp. 2063]|nr:hypothetical protein [Phyllobacterium sp. 2063]